MGESFSENIKLPPMWLKTLVCEENPALVRTLPKTPYQLDLEVKDRKPSIIPKVGDKVKIKSREWYERWKNGCGYVDIPGHFILPMEKFCGEVLTVEEFRYGCFKMKEDECKWNFSPEMFEEVYPVQEQLSSKFPKIDLNSPYLHQSPYEVKGSELIFSKKEEERFLQQLRNQWGIKPKLKQIKTTHLIKLKKL